MADEVESFSVVVQSRSFSCCGTILDREAGIIITVGSIVKGLWHQNGENAGLSSPIHVQERDVPVQPVQIVLKRTPQKHTSSNDFITLDGKIVAFWRDKRIEEICKSMFPSMEWTFDADTSTKCVEERDDECFQGKNNSPLFLADFALIEVKNLSTYLSSMSSLNIRENVSVGQTVTIVGTPFGSECWSIFFNSISQGIVSNIIGSNTEMILTDARCVPGCEGCPVFLDSVPGNASSMYGIVVAPFCWRSGEWIGLTLVCSIKHMLKTLLETNILPKIIPLENLLELGLNINEKSVAASPDNTLCTHPNNNNDQETFYRNQECHTADVLDNSRPCVVLIKCGTTWGSGIVIDSDNGLVITCRHILTEGGLLKSSDTSPSASCFSNREGSLIIHDVLSHSVYDHVEIAFAASQDYALDFVLLKVKKHNFKVSIKLRDGFPYSNVFRKGEDVLAIGYSLFGSDLSNGPCITAGALSNVTYIGGIPAMIQSSAAVHCGGSGGAIVSTNTGELLGMVTCNTRDANSSSSFPHINFSIPSNLILRLTALSLSDAKNKGVYLMDLVSTVESAWHLDSNRNLKSKL